jgi:UDP-N-acetylmuramoylalanine--D-glutamate ligase
VPTASYPTLGEAINFACQSARSGVVLLSPAATSYDEFTSFEERGDFYKNKVLSIKSK